MREEVAGVDEVGRGCLFGPVFASAVVLNKSAINLLRSAGLTDSKRLSPKKRATLVPLIKSASTAWSIGEASSHEIDNHGIRMATEQAMLRALQKLPTEPSLVLIDGSLPLRLWKGPQQNIIRGDSKFAEISAASVIAKEARDQLIKSMAKEFPEYGLDKHVGYGTKIHRDALILHGPTKLHRVSFLKKVLPEQARN